MAEHLLVSHPAAREEALAAYDWYAERNVDAAEAFQLELEGAGRKIAESPEAWVPYQHGTRGFLLQTFPFSVIYRSREDRIEVIAVIAVAHQRRRPGYWANRLGTSDSGE